MALEDAPAHLGEGLEESRIRIQVQNVEVIGRTTYRSSRGIRVEILEPYTGLSSSCWIPYFAAGIRSFLGEPGDSTALRLLQEAFSLGKFIEENFTELQQVWPQFAAIGARRQLHREHFLEARKKLRVALRKRDLTPVQYQKALTDTRKNQEDADRQVFLAQEAFLKQYFPAPLTMCDLERQVAPILEERRPLRLRKEAATPSPDDEPSHA